MEKQTNKPKKRILLVEDEREMRVMIKDMLHLDAHEVVEANNGAEAMSLFAQGHFDLVMTDHAMPFVDGSELAARIRRVAPSKPILMVTGHGHKVGPNNPVNQVVGKPFGCQTLRSAVQSLLNVSSAESQV
jgi:DNA-binding response OmpR family regulator